MRRYAALLCLGLLIGVFNIPTANGLEPTYPLNEISRATSLIPASVRTESAVGVPRSDAVTPLVTIEDERFEINVHAFGRFWDSLLALHPSTKEIYFSDFKNKYYWSEYYYDIVNMTEEERDELYRRQIFCIPRYSYRTLTHSIAPQFQMPTIVGSQVKPIDMDVDSQRNAFLLTDSQHILKVDPNLSSKSIYHDSAATLLSIRISRNAVPRYGIQKDDLFVLIGSEDGQSSIHNKLIILSPQDNSTYAPRAILMQSDLVMTDITVGGDGRIYCLSRNPLGLHRLLENGEIEPVGDGLLSNTIKSDCKFEYLPATESFFVYPKSSHYLYEVNTEGTITNTLDSKYLIADTTVSPDGNVLYLLIKYGSYDYGSIQSLLHVESRIKELELGDFNSDGSYGSEDVEELLGVYLKGQALRSTDIDYLDANGDGVITPQDVQEMWKKNGRF